MFIGWQAGLGYLFRSDVCLAILLAELSCLFEHGKCSAQIAAGLFQQ